MIIKAAMVKLTKASVLYANKLVLPKLSNPALQNAEIARKMEVRSPFPHPKRGTNRKLRINAPRASMLKVMRKMERRKSRIEFVSSRLRLSCKVVRLEKLSF